MIMIHERIKTKRFSKKFDVKSTSFYPAKLTDMYIKRSIDNSVKFGIYLGAFEAQHDGYNILYQDINGKRDIGGDMLDIDLSPYDYIIATPPCNFWSRARGKRCSDYSKKTQHLLPDIIDKLLKIGKPFIVENVRNSKRFIEYGLFDKPCFIIEFGRHTYWTNVLVDFSGIEQRQDFKTHGYVIKYDDMPNTKHQGGFNVHSVIDYWLKVIHKERRKK